MTTPDYPLLVLPSHEMYQVAHIATYIADALARHRAAGNRNGRRWIARRDIAGGRAAYDCALRASAPTPPDRLPRPIDATTYRAAREIVSAGPREAEVVSLELTGRSGWAVVGQVPGIGPVDAVTPSKAEDPDRRGPHPGDRRRGHPGRRLTRLVGAVPPQVARPRTSAARLCRRLRAGVPSSPTRPDRRFRRARQPR